MNRKKWKLVFASIGFFVYSAYLWDDYKEPSDSGKMSWFTFLMVEHQAGQGDGKALAQLVHHYEMDDAQEHAVEISELLFDSVTFGYGGKKLGRDRLTMSFIENCANLGAKGPEKTAKLFALVRERGGGLTPYGQDVEARWLSGEFTNCALPTNRSGLPVRE